MEYVDGADLGELLDDREAPLGFDEAAAVVEAVSAALEYAHDNGVLHLDIKPENVLVTRDGLVKVTDFGVATLSAITGHGPGVGGTLGYMPVEQLRGNDVDERTDVWALASLSYEILTNANPFVADSIEGAIFKADVIDDIPDASAFEDDLAPEIDDILAAGLATDPDERYGSVAEFSDRLLQYLGDPALGTADLADAVEEYAGEEDERARTRTSRAVGPAAPLHALRVRVRGRHHRRVAHVGGPHPARDPDPRRRGCDRASGRRRGHPARTWP